MDGQNGKKAAAAARLRVVGRHVAAATVSSAASRRHQYSDAEWKQRCDLAAGYRIAHEQGWDQVIYNHITLKVKGSDGVPGGPHFLINPFGLRFDEITAGKLLKVDVEGRVVDPGDGSGPLFNQGFVVHSTIHSARSDIHCVVHNHHQPTVAVAMSKHGLLPLSQECIPFVRNTSYHPFEGTTTDFCERERMAKALGPKNKVMILLNHGPLTGGTTIGEAFTLMFALTRACEYQQMALAAVGGDLSKINIPTEAQIDGMVKRATMNPVKMEVNQADLMFEAFRREMEDKYGAENIYR